MSGTQKASPKGVTSPAYQSDLLRGYCAGDLRLIHRGAAPVSVYAMFLRCPRCAYLAFVRQVGFAKTKASIRGMFHHTAFEHLMAREFHLACNFDPSDPDMVMVENFRRELYSMKRELEGRFLREFEYVDADYGIELHFLEKHLKEAYTDWLRRLRGFALAQKLSGIELARAFVPFRKFEVYLSAPVLGFLGGRIDVLEDGMPVEIKTGKPPETGLLPHHELQLVCYAILLEYCTGIDVEYAEAYYTRIHRRRRINIDRDKRVFALRTIDKALDVLGKAEPPDTSCRLCSSLSGGHFLA